LLLLVAGTGALCWALLDSDDAAVVQQPPPPTTQAILPIDPTPPSPTPPLRLAARQASPAAEAAYVTASKLQAIAAFDEGDFDRAFRLANQARAASTDGAVLDELCRMTKQAVQKEREAAALRLVHLSEASRHEPTPTVAQGPTAPPREEPAQPAVEPPAPAPAKVIAEPQRKPLAAEQQQRMRYLVERAEFHLRMGQLYCAVLALRECVELDPEDARVAGMLDDVRQRLGKVVTEKSDGPVQATTYLLSGCAHCGEPEFFQGRSKPLEAEASSVAFMPLLYRYLYAPGPAPRSLRDPAVIASKPGFLPLAERYRQEPLLRPDPPRPPLALETLQPAPVPLLQRYLQMPAAERQKAVMTDPAIRTTMPAWQRYLEQPNSSSGMSVREKFLSHPDTKAIPSWRERLLETPAPITSSSREKYANLAPATPSIREQYLNMPGPAATTPRDRYGEMQPYTPSLRERYLAAPTPTTSSARDKYADTLPVGPSPRDRYLQQPGPTTSSSRDRYLDNLSSGPSLRDRYLMGDPPTTSSPRSKYLDHLPATPTVRELYLQSEGPTTRSARDRYLDPLATPLPSDTGNRPSTTGLPPNRYDEAWRLLPNVPSDRSATPAAPAVEKPNTPLKPPVPAVRVP
jgi:hypothetical protein